MEHVCVGSTVALDADIPEVFIHTDLAVRNKHPLYRSAKSGDIDAAKSFDEMLVSIEETTRIKEFISGRPVILLPVTADEVDGFNAIPDAVANALGLRLDMTVAAGMVVQANKVGHTKANGWHRLVTPAMFIGEIVEGADYFLVDDHVGFGGTLANLRGFVEEGGGHVLGMTMLTETRAARRIAIRDETLDMLRHRHGHALEEFWYAEFGHRLDCLTDIEAGYLSRVESLDVIKNRMAQAAKSARGRGFSPAGVVATTPS